MTAQELQDALRDIIEALLFARDEGDLDDGVADLVDHVEGISRIHTYDDVGMLTRDKGLVVECDGGSEYQVSIVQSR